MRAGGSKQKGSSFERNICKQLSMWITNGKRDDVFWRSAMSGGRATVAHRKGQDIRQSGDITSVAPEGHILTDHWFIELKHYKNPELLAFFIKGRGTSAKFWKHAKQQAYDHNKEPILIIKQNNMPILVIAKSDSLINDYPLIVLKDCSVWSFDVFIKTRPEAMGIMTRTSFL